MAKFSEKLQGKEVGQASKYAEPHTPKGTDLNTKDLGGGAFDYSDMKTEGIAQRGHGAAVKGFTSRGPLA
jgi:hypothetical protein